MYVSIIAPEQTGVAVGLALEQPFGEVDGDHDSNSLADGVFSGAGIERGPATHPSHRQRK